MTAKSDLLATLTSNGVLAKLDCLYLLNQGTKVEALVNQVNPGTYDATEVGTPLFSPNNGFAGNLGTVSYLTTNFNPSTAVGANFVQNAASISVWVNSAFSQDEAIAGYYDGTGGVTVAPRVQVQNNSAMFRMNQNSLTTSGATHTSAKGYWTVMRRASGSATMRLNASTFSTNAQPSVAIKNGAIRICGQSNTSISTHQIAVVAIGSLADADDLLLYNALVTYMAAQGNVASGQVSASVGSVVIPNDSVVPDGEAIAVSVGSVTVEEGTSVSPTGESMTADVGVIPFPIEVEVTGSGMTLSNGDEAVDISVGVIAEGMTISAHVNDVDLNENVTVYLTGLGVTSYCSQVRWWDVIPNPPSAVWKVIR